MECYLALQNDIPEEFLVISKGGTKPYLNIFSGKKNLTHHLHCCMVGGAERKHTER
jgi:hypothetical protein